MKLTPVMLLILFHIILAGIGIISILSGRLSLRKEHLLPVIFLPVFGPCLAFIIAWMNITGEQGNQTPDSEPPTPEEDILWTSLKSFHEKGNLVPLEEAILINDVKTRRKFMLDTLYEDPLKYLDILMLAKNNEDVETSHYATTTISHAQREFQVAVQELSVGVDQNPENLDLLDRYIETLGKYIASGLLEEHLLSNLRIVYKEILERKLARATHDRMALIQKLRNSIALKEWFIAYETSDLLKAHWPADEQTWIEAVRMCVEGKDNNRLLEIAGEIEQTNILWTKQGKEQIRAWIRVNGS